MRVRIVSSLLAMGEAAGIGDPWQVGTGRPSRSHLYGRPGGPSSARERPSPPRSPRSTGPSWYHKASGTSSPFKSPASSCTSPPAPTETLDLSPLRRIGPPHIRGAGDECGANRGPRPGEPDRDRL